MSIPAAILVGCVLSQVALTFWAIISVGLARIDALKCHQVTLSEMAVSDAPWPMPIQLLQANLRNQCETPILLFALAPLAISLDATNWGVALGCAIYLGARILHRRIHVTDNHVPHRFRMFVLGLAGLATAWLSLFVDLLL